MNVLITTPHWQSALACVQSLGRAGHSVSVLGYRRGHPNEHSVYIEKRFEWTSTVPERAASELNRIIDENGFDFVIPISDWDAEVAALANEDRGSRRCIVGSVEAVRISRDRSRTVALCQSAGVATPESATASRSNAAAVARRIGYPCFLKLSDSVASEGVFRLTSEEELERRLQQVPDSADFQIQREIEGSCVGIMGYAHAGKLVDSFSFEAVSVSYPGGNPPYVRALADPALPPILEKIVAALAWTGGIDIDLQRDSAGRSFLLEINPRLSGTAVFPLKSGIDFPSYYATTASGATPHKQERINPKTPDRYLSVAEEAAFIRRAGHDGRQLALQFRSGGAYSDNSFWNDRGYSRALFYQLQQILLA